MTETGSGRRTRSLLVEVVETLLLTLAIFFGIHTFVAQPYQVQQVSMENSLLPNQYVLVDKLTPRWSPYARGDIVVFDAPPGVREGPAVPFIKRVIGLPGDVVRLRDGRVYVNGVALNEPYVFTEGGHRQRTDPVAGGQTEWFVPQGELFVLGDHRLESSDSRAFGPLAISAVIGRAWLRYWPIDSFGVLQTPAYASPGPSGGRTSRRTARNGAREPRAPNLIGDVRGRSAPLA